jgi:D-amino-acid dehydrogenase
MPRHILIIGGGIIGLSTAYYARRKGHTVTVVERNGRVRDMASLGNAGMIVPSHLTQLATPANVRFGLRNLWNPESPFYIRPRLDPALISWGLKFIGSATAEKIERSAPVFRDLSMLSRKLYVELAEERDNDFGLQQRGLFELCNTAEGLHEEAHFAAYANKLGVPAEVLTPEEVRKLDPGVTLDITGAVYFPKDCHLSPDRLIVGMAQRLEADGVRFEYDARVTGWRCADGHVDGVIVSDATGERTLQADEYVVAGGVWSDQMARELGFSLPMQGGKGYSLTLPQPRETPQICALLTEARAAVTPMLGGLRVGGTMEIAGLDESIDPRRVRGILKSFCRYYTAFTPDDFAGVPVWRGLRPVAPDGLPYVGRVRKYVNLSVAAGHAMLGLSLGPVTGLLMSEILSGEAPSVDVTALAPERFGE